MWLCSVTHSQDWGKKRLPGWLWSTLGAEARPDFSLWPYLSVGQLRRTAPHSDERSLTGPNLETLARGLGHCAVPYPYKKTHVTNSNQFGARKQKGDSGAGKGSNSWLLAAFCIIWMSPLSPKTVVCLHCGALGKAAPASPESSAHSLASKLGSEKSPSLTGEALSCPLL